MYWIIIQYEINWPIQVANVIQNLRLIFLLLSISGIAIAGSNTFYKYEYEYVCYIRNKQASVNKSISE